MCQAFLPIMKERGRIANVSSESGNPQAFGPEVASRLRDPRNTLQNVEELSREYEVSTHRISDKSIWCPCTPPWKDHRIDDRARAQELSLRGAATAAGWAHKPYFVSKALETAMTMALAREQPQCFINACCPGWVTTDLGKQAGPPPKTPGELFFPPHASSQAGGMFISQSYARRSHRHLRDRARGESSHPFRIRGHGRRDGEMVG